MEYDEFYRKAIDMVARDYINRYHKEPGINVHELGKPNNYGALIMCDDIAVYAVGFNKKTKDDIIGIVRYRIPLIGYPSVEISEIKNK